MQNPYNPYNNPNSNVNISECFGDLDVMLQIALDKKGT